jgi:phenylacetate-CoA ligase
VEQILLRHGGLDHEYQILLESAEGGDRLILCVEAGPGFDPVAEARLSREFHDFLGLSPEIRRLGIGEIPRPQGKAVRVVDHRAGRRA